MANSVLICMFVLLPVTATARTTVIAGPDVRDQFLGLPQHATLLVGFPTYKHIINLHHEENIVDHRIIMALLSRYFNEVITRINIRVKSNLTPA